MSRIAVVRYTFDGDREENIKLGVKKVLFLMYESLRTYRAQRKAASQAAQAAQTAQTPPPAAAQSVGDNHTN